MQDLARHHSVFFMILRRLRAPLILLITLFAISVLGLTLAPGPYTAQVSGVAATTGLALAVIAALAHRELVPVAAVVLALVFTLRTAWLVTRLRPDWPAKRVGILEAALGVAMLAALAVAY